MGKDVMVFGKPLCRAASGEWVAKSTTKPSPSTSGDILATVTITRSRRSDPAAFTTTHPASIWVIGFIRTAPPCYMGLPATIVIFQAL